MGMKRPIFIIMAASIMLLGLSFTVSAATVKGTVYDMFLGELDNAVVTIDSTPAQTIVAKDATYTFTVAKGTYTLRAAFEDLDGLYLTEEKVVISDDGEYILDLILFLSEEDSFEDFLDDIEVLEPEVPEEQQSIVWWWAALILAVMLAWWALQKKSKHGPEQVAEETEEVAADILRFIKKEGGRATQKDIRKQFGVSEAKISLVIADLESQKKIRKIKKGRGNIIVLK